jgi:hypothetical protein
MGCRERVSAHTSRSCACLRGHNRSPRIARAWYIRDPRDAPIGSKYREGAEQHFAQQFDGSAARSNLLSLIQRMMCRLCPMISLDLARQTWRYWTERARLDGRFRDLGDALIYGQVSADLNPNRALLGVPMFSHLHSPILCFANLTKNYHTYCRRSVYGT